jgi:MYXO-CTERM domain-containing protein
VGIVLLLSGKDDAATKMSVAQDFAPLAAAFAPTFATATSGKGTLEIVTDNIGQGGSGGAGQGGSGGGGQGGSGGQGTTTTTDTGGGGAGESDTGAGCGCQLPGSTGVTPPALYAALALGLAALRRRKRAASIRR